MTLASRDFTNDQRHWRQHIALRVLGLVFMGMGVAATSWLERLVHRAPPHEPSGSELGVALIVIFTFCFGAALLINGRALLEPDCSPRAQGSQSQSFKGSSDD